MDGTQESRNDAEEDRPAPTPMSGTSKLNELVVVESPDAKGAEGKARKETLFLLGLAFAFPASPKVKRPPGGRERRKQKQNVFPIGKAPLRVFEN